MTAGASGPVAVDRDTEVVDGIFLAMENIFLPVDVLFKFPGPVTGLHDIVGGLIMAFKALQGYFHWCIEWPTDFEVLFVGLGDHDACGQDRAENAYGLDNLHVKTSRQYYGNKELIVSSSLID